MSKIFSNFVPKLEAMNLYSTLFYVDVEGHREKVEHLEYFETRKACVEFAQKLAKALSALFWIQDRNQDMITDDVEQAWASVPEGLRYRTTIADYRDYDFCLEE